jgi:hypothetical protein
VYGKGEGIVGYYNRSLICNTAGSRLVASAVFRLIAVFQLQTTKTRRHSIQAVLDNLEFEINFSESDDLGEWSLLAGVGRMGGTV